MYQIEDTREPEKREWAFRCDGCGEEIFVGDTCYELREGQIFCEECMDDYIRSCKKTAEY